MTHNPIGPPLHVLIIPSWYPSEDDPVAGSFFREQALALCRRGHQVGVVYPEMHSLRRWRELVKGTRGMGRTQDDCLATFRFRGLLWFPFARRLHAWLWVQRGLQLYEAYRREFGDPDLIHVHSMLSAGLLAIQIQERYGVPYVVTEHSTEYARRLVLGWRRSAATKVAERASMRLAVSRPFADLLERELGSGAGAWDEMPNIVEHRFGEVSLGRPRAQSQGFRFVTVALLAKKKGVHFLLQAFAQAFHAESSVCLEVGGDGPERPRLEDLARGLGIAGRVRFLGRLSRDEVRGAMSRADAFVLASTVETFGVVVIEALALGKPVVATRCGGPEAIVREEDGILVEPGDIDALARAMRSIRENASRYTPEEIRRACMARFGEAAVVKRLTKTYESVVKQSAGAR